MPKPPVHPVIIRHALLQDLPAITDIYNHAIVHTVSTFDTQTKTVAQQQRWFEQHGSTHPIWVACQCETIVGWTSLSPWSDLCAYTKTAETSTCIDVNHRGKGIGKKLLQTALTRAKQLHHRNILARIVSTQKASAQLHQSLGFTLVGTMNQVGERFGQVHDVDLYQHLLLLTAHNH